MRRLTEGADVETRFRAVFVHLGAVTAYARRRGSLDPDALAAETMTIAWRKLEDVPRDDARPWLFATARNLLLAESRKRAAPAHDSGVITMHQAAFEFAPPAEARALDPQLIAALRSLAPDEREALLLIAWEDLTPALAAKALQISQAAFRVRLHRARRRLQSALAANAAHPSLRCLEMEER